MIEYNNLTVIDEEYVKVTSVQVKIPIARSANISFNTENRELIHIAIDEDELREFIKWDEWELLLRMILFKDKHIKQSALDQFCEWRLSSIQFKFIHVPCTTPEIESFKFTRADQRGEILSGNKQVVYRQYRNRASGTQKNSLMLGLPWEKEI
jgi:hypothetical protein